MFCQLGSHTKTELEFGPNFFEFEKPYAKYNVIRISFIVVAPGTRFLLNGENSWKLSSYFNLSISFFSAPGLSRTTFVQFKQTSPLFRQRKCQSLVSRHSSKHKFESALRYKNQCPLLCLASEKTWSYYHMYAIMSNAETSNLKVAQALSPVFAKTRQIMKTRISRFIRKNYPGIRVHLGFCTCSRNHNIGIDSFRKTHI